LYSYNPANNTWTQYQPYGQVPSRRSMHSAVTVGKKFYIFGGACSKSLDSDDTSAFCDLHEFDTNTFLWNECEVSGTPPTPCFGHTSSYVEHRNQIIFFGGKGYHVVSDINIINLEKMEYKRYAFGGNILPSRWGHAAIVIENKLLLFGGRDDTRYWSSYSVIDLDSQLIELVAEESAAEILRKKAEQMKQRRELISSLQNEVEDLRAMVTNIGEELMRQKKEKEAISQMLDVMEEENAFLSKKLVQSY